MEITAYALYDQPVPIRPAPAQRDWLDPLEEDIALALNTASGNGWELLCPYSFEAIWRGGSGPGDIEISAPGFVTSRLGNGILTFETGYIFKIEGGHDLWVRGPINYPKVGLFPLDALIATYSLPCTFSMHWKFTEANQPVRFEKGEPFCTIYPYPQNYVEEFAGEIRKINDQPEVYADHLRWQELKGKVLAGEVVDLSPPPEPQALDRQRKEVTNRAKDLPPVSCICPTYGRPELLEEAIYSFLQQDYAGQKELIVVNDYDQQFLEFDHPEVQIINFPKRFHTVGEKYKAAVALCSYDLIFVWHDDDIYLPHRLTFSVEQFDWEKGFFKPDQAWFWNYGQLSGPERNVFHGGSCWSRELFGQVRGYAHINNGYDQELERRVEVEKPGSTKVFPIKPAEMFYVYRWQGTGSYHLSSFGSDGYDQSAVYVQNELEQGRLKQGRVRLNPQWRLEYSKLVQNYRSKIPLEAKQVESKILDSVEPPPIFFAATPPPLSEAEEKQLFKGSSPVKISVILPAANESIYLQRTVDQFQATLPAEREIIVVDNGSTDGCTDFLVGEQDSFAPAGMPEGSRQSRGNGPVLSASSDSAPVTRLSTANGVHLLRTEKTLGVVGARNLGLKQATGEVIVFADAHVDVPPGWWQHLVAALNQPNVGMVGPAITVMGKPELPKACGQRVTGSDLRTEWLAPRQESPYAVPVLGGGFLALRRETLNAVGHFDGGMQQWGAEDLELSLRLWLLGYEVWVAPEVEVAHYFREKNPYYVDWVSVMHNTLRVAFLHFNQARMARVLEALKDRPEYGNALALCAESDVWQQRANLAARRVHDDDWYFDRFQTMDCSA
jgi:glycosyltransferase involved in cell wall biosynthesis